MTHTRIHCGRCSNVLTFILKLKGQKITRYSFSHRRRTKNKRGWWQQRLRGRWVGWHWLMGRSPLFLLLIILLLFPVLSDSGVKVQGSKSHPLALLSILIIPYSFLSLISCHLPLFTSPSPSVHFQRHCDMMFLTSRDRMWTFWNFTVHFLENKFAEKGSIWHLDV